jgi:hypothetical protein
MNKHRNRKSFASLLQWTTQHTLSLPVMLAALVVNFLVLQSANAASREEQFVNPAADGADTVLNSPGPTEATTQPVAEPVAEQADNSSRDKLAELQEALAAQRDQLEQQQTQIESQQQRALEQQKNIDAQTSLLDSMQQQLDELAEAAGRPREATPEQLKMREQLAGLQEQLAQIPEDPSASMAGEGFPGSIRVPGTDAAYKIGGYAKMSIVKSFDPVGTEDRFIVGSIPVDATDAEIVGSDTDLTADHTRLNFEVRQDTSIGQFRAFVEGDFAGFEDSLRLRHAYGQFRNVLAGKTWSVFYDPLAQPEQVDFEGINGIVNLRQAQLRYFPAIGKSWELAVSLEDPVSEATEMDPFSGEPIDSINDSEVPDLVASVRRKWFGRWTLRSAFVLRRLSATSFFDNSVDDSKLAFGVNIGGSISVPQWNELDNVKFQLVYGRGIGRYINDTNTIGGLDAVFDPDGDLKVLPILAANIAYQHWWQPKLRSTFLYSIVDVDTYGFQPDSAYARTQRVAANLLWSPIPRIDVGAELLYGKRTNKDDSSGDAIQMQIAAKYRF